MAMTRSEISRKYNDAHTKRIQLAFNVKTDADIIKRLETIDESKMGYIKRLIREDMAKDWLK